MSQQTMSHQHQAVGGSGGQPGIQRNSRRGSGQPGKWRTRLGQFEWKASPYLYIAPFFILFAIVGLFPLVKTWSWSSRNWNTLNSWRRRGLRYAAPPAGPPRPHGSAISHGSCTSRLYVALRNSVSIFLLSSVLQIMLALLLAWILDANPKAKTFWRMGVLLPYVVAPSVAGIIFSQIFSDKMGAINVLLQQIGMNPIMWHGSTMARSHIAIATIVNFPLTGYNTLILLCRHAGQPRDVVEGSIVDGAGKWCTFRSVTLPMLRPTLIFVIITSTIGGLQIFDEPRSSSTTRPARAAASTTST